VQSSFASDKGLCCSFADGFRLTTSIGIACGPRVEWIVVPDDAVVTKSNKFGPAVVWPYMESNRAQLPPCTHYCPENRIGRTSCVLISLTYSKH
jgi:hypothetical protein